MRASWTNSNSLADRGQTARARLTVGSGASDQPSHRLKLGDAPLDSFERNIETPPFTVTRSAAGVVGGQRVHDLIERQTHTLQTARQPESLDDVDRVVAIPRRSTVRFGEHTTSFVEPDRVHRHPGRRRNLTNLHRRLLTLDMTPEFTLHS